MRSHRFKLCAVVVMFVCAAVLVCGCGPRRFRGENKPSVPKDPPDRSIVTFCFRPSGDKDARYYAAGFGGALSDRLCCAPGSPLIQPNRDMMREKLCLVKLSLRAPVPDDVAAKVGKNLGVRYAITGGLSLSGDKVSISVRMRDLTGKSPKPLDIERSGTLNDLPRIQTEVAEEIVKGLGMNPRKALAGSFGGPNFSKPSTLLLYGRAFYTDDAKRSLEYAWQAVDEDPGSSFAPLPLLRFYQYKPSFRAIQSNKRLQALVKDAQRKFPDNPQISVLSAWLLVRQYRYKEAEVALRDLVDRAPDFAPGHDALANVATYRDDPELAVREARKLVELWPTCARSHIVLAWAYECAATSARQGHYFNEMSARVRRTWERNSRLAYQEASVAIALDRRASYAWETLMDRSRELGYGDYDRKAFEEMVKINPRNFAAYSTYICSLMPQWGGTEDQRRELCSRVDKAFGKDSVESCIIRGDEILCEEHHEARRPEVLRLAEKALKTSKGKDLRALNLKCRVFIGLHRRAEMLKLAKKGFEMDPSPMWRMLLARGYGFRWEEAHDPNALSEACKLLMVYVDELPNDPYGHDQLGWCLSHMGNRLLAKKEFLRALELDPADEMAKEKLTYVQ